jgi:hypothetical protein
MYSISCLASSILRSKEKFPDSNKLTKLTSLPITTHKTICSIEVCAAFHKEKPPSPGDTNGDVTCDPRDSLVATAQAEPS